MRKFIRYCILFAIPLVGVVIAMEYMARRTPNPYSYKYEWMEQHAEQVNTILLGSSHNFYGVCPQLFPELTFNMANVSQEVEQDLWLLKHWAPRYKHLKTVVLCMSTIFWFNKGLENGDEAFRCRNYKIYMHCDLYPALSEYSFEVAAWPIARNKIAHASDNGCNELGQGTAFALANKEVEKWDDEKKGIKAARHHTPDNWNYIEKNYRLMSELAEFCSSRGIRLVLITTPTWHTYYNHVYPRQLAMMHRLTKKFQEQYNITYLDYLTDPRFVADDFYDNNHLSDVGAVKFTKILLSDMYGE